MDLEKHATDIAYPYMPNEGRIVYESADNEYMEVAKAFAAAESLDEHMPNASVIVKDGSIVGRGANGSTYHQEHGCERVRLGIPTGQGYELCEGCHPKNHSEAKAIKNAQENGITDLQDADLYLWGHWWCCEPCWKAMLAHGIKTVHLLKHSEVLFNKAALGNIVGKQFVA